MNILVHSCTMNLARADTYINVYLPRLDGEDPRRYNRPASPMFDTDSTYKFSDQILKDRPLFLGKKQMSLYEIYYKDNGGCVSLEKTNAATSQTFSDADVNTDDSEKKPQQAELQNVNRISLSLDDRVNQVYKPSIRRFNEPLNAYVTNKKRILTANRSSLEADENLESLNTSLDLSQTKPVRAFHDNPLKIRNSRKLYKKSPSAPPETRQRRGIGLPPITLNNKKAGVSDLADMNSPRTVVHAMPMRQSSKPQSIWRQSTDVFLHRFSPQVTKNARLTYVNTSARPAKVLFSSVR